MQVDSRGSHLVSAEQDDVVAAYKAIRGELSAFGQGLDGKNELVVLSKTDLVTDEERKAKLASLETIAGEGKVIPLSVIDDELLKAFSDTLASLLKK